MACTRAALIGAGLSLAVLAAAAAQEREAGYLSPGIGRISGLVTIVDAGQRLPLRRAVVTVSATTAKNALGSVSTDAQGQFVFDRLAPGRYRVVVAKPGFVTVSPTPDHILDPAGDVKISVDVQRAGAAEGRIVDDRGVPIDSVKVMAELITPAAGTVSPASYQANTDDRGRFRIHTLPPGRYRVLALPSATDPERRLYFPGTEAVSEAALIDVSSGDTVERLDFVLPIGQPSAMAAEAVAAIEREFQAPESPGFDGRITGRVTRTDVGLPVSGAAVTVYSSSGVSLRSAMADGDGQFAFPRLSPGKYIVAASAAGFVSPAPSRASVAGGTQVTIASGSRERVDPGLIPVSALEIRVTDEFGDPAPGVFLRITRRNSALPASAGLVPLARLWRVPTDDRGWLRAPQLVPGEYFVAALPSPFAPSAAAPFAPTYFPGVPSADAAIPIHVGAGIDVQLTLALGSVKVTTVSGVVQDHTGRRLSGARLVLVPDGVTNGLSTAGPAVLSTATAGQTATIAAKDGSFVFRDIPEGRYQLHGSGGTTFGTTEFTVADSATPPVVLRLKPLTTVRGRIHFDGASPPVSTEFLQLGFRPSSPAVVVGLPPLSGAAVIGPNGDFEIRNIGSPGLLAQSPHPGFAWTLSRVVHNGRDITDVPYDFQDGDTDGVEIFFTTRLGTLTGTVRDTTGAVSRTAVLVFGAEKTSPHYVSRTTYIGQTNDQGVFEIRRILPGRYYAIAPSGGLSLSAESLEEFRKTASVVIVGADSTAKITLTSMK
jgi:hypothetical protein